VDYEDEAWRRAKIARTLDNLDRARAGLKAQIEAAAHGQPPPIESVLAETLAGLAEQREALEVELDRRRQMQQQTMGYFREMGVDASDVPDLETLSNVGVSAAEDALMHILTRSRELRDQYVGEVIAARLARDSNLDLEATLLEARAYSPAELDQLHEWLVRTQVQQAVPGKPSATRCKHGETESEMLELLFTLVVDWLLEQNLEQYQRQIKGPRWLSAERLQRLVPTETQLATQFASGRSELSRRINCFTNWHAAIKQVLPRATERAIDLERAAGRLEEWSQASG
jgi:hypothetical protein